MPCLTPVCILAKFGGHGLEKRQPENGLNWLSKEKRTHMKTNNRTGHQNWLDLGTYGNSENETYDSPDSARSSALSKSASTMANLRATCRKQLDKYDQMVCF